MTNFCKILWVGSCTGARNRYNSYPNHQVTGVNSFPNPYGSGPANTVKKNPPTSVLQKQGKRWGKSP